MRAILAIVASLLPMVLHGQDAPAGRNPDFDARIRPILTTH